MIDSKRLKNRERYWNGLHVVVETPAGTGRKGRDKNGKSWKRKFFWDYGCIRRTRGRDGD